MSKTPRRPQRQKQPHSKIVARQELRRSNAAGIHRAANNYVRRGKYAGWGEGE